MKQVKWNNKKFFQSLSLTRNTFWSSVEIEMHFVENAFQSDTEQICSTFEQKCFCTAWEILSIYMSQAFALQLNFIVFFYDRARVIFSCAFLAIVACVLMGYCGPVAFSVATILYKAGSEKNLHKLVSSRIKQVSN